jgi:hypothetical protein
VLVELKHQGHLTKNSVSAIYIQYSSRRDTSQELDGMRKHGKNCRQVLFHSFDTARQVHDESSLSHAYHISSGSEDENSLPASHLPAAGRDSIACGVTFSDSWIIATTRPGASRSKIAFVASGVTSRGEKPVPPVVTDQIR